MTEKQADATVKDKMPDPNHYPNLGQKEARAEKESEEQLHQMGEMSPQSKEGENAKHRPAER